MSRFLRNAAVAALTLAAAGTVASAASAQSYNRLVVFGDSLSDNGNLFAAIGTPPAPFYQGRFSNGPVFTELLGFNAGRVTAGAPVTGSVNYAFGGAVTGNSALPLGMRSQLSAYVGGGGVFGPNDLVSVLGGANNIFAGLEAYRLLPVGDPRLANPQGFVAPYATGAAADINFIVNDIAGRGAGTILVSNLPRLGFTPRARAGGASSMALSDFVGQTFNTALANGLQGVAAARPNSNIILVDLYRASEVLTSNPGAFGLTNVTNSCFNETALTVCSTPDSYLYWDSIHPTAAGHRLLGALATDYMYYGDRGAQTTVLGETAFRKREEALDAASETVSGRDAWEPGTRLTFEALVDRSESDARGVVQASEAEGWGGRVAIDAVVSPNWRAGVAGSFQSTDLSSASLNLTAETYSADAWLGWRDGNLFANISAGGSIDQYEEIERLTGLAPVIHTGSTNGRSWGARVQGGMWFDMGGIAISPRAAVTWGLSKVNGWQETGPAAVYNYMDREVSGVSGEIALRAEGGGDGVRFYAEGGYRDSLSDSSDAVGVGIVGNTAQVLYRDIDDPFGGSMLASAGVEMDMAGGTLSVGYRGRFGDEADSHLGAIRFSLPLN